MFFLAVSPLVSLLHARHWPNRCTVVSNGIRVLHKTSRSVSETAAPAVHHTLSLRRATDVEQLKGGTRDYAIASERPSKVGPSNIETIPHPIQNSVG